MAPTLREHQRSSAFRMLGIGDSGTGKTGSLVEVINNMDELGLERVIVSDFDFGLDVLTQFVKPEMQDRVFVESFRDKLRADLESGSSVAEKSALSASWTNAVMRFSNWPEVGNIGALDTKSLFVVDSLTGLGDSNFNYAVAFGKDGGDRWRSTGAAMGLQDKFVQLCVSLECHFILFSHIRYMGGGGRQMVEDKKGSKYMVEVDSKTEGNAYPSALGKLLPTQISRHFNTMLEYKIVGKSRVIRTVPDKEGRMALKLPLAGQPEELDQETGLFKIMKAFLERK